MPLVGLSPFLLKSKREFLTYESVSMPLVGLSPFLPASVGLKTARLVRVSMPLVGLSPFLRM